MFDYDVVVIGAGPGGYPAAIRPYTGCNPRPARGLKPVIFLIGSAHV